MNRAPAVQGSFYPDSCDGITSLLERFNQLLKEGLSDQTVLARQPKAVIVPHAGYVYSGFTANIAYRILQNSRLKKFAIIGPSHRVYLEGTSIGRFDLVETPCGTIACDSAMIEELSQRFDLSFVPDAHHEHSTETQFPFARFYLGEIEVIELVYGKEDPEHLSRIIRYLLTQPQWGVIISTDLSHFYTQTEAEKRDFLCLQAVGHGKPELLHQGGEACGAIGIEAMIEAAQPLSLQPEVLDYRTSADASGDTSRVVGYMSAMYY